MRRYCFEFSLFVIIALFSTNVSCSKKTKIVSKHRLQLNINQNHLTLDPRKGCDLSSVSVQYLLFQGLVQMTPYATRAYALAENMEVSEDKLIYKFTLRESYWSNGAPMTAYDFVQSWKDNLHPNFISPNVHLLYVIKNAELAKSGLVPEREIGIKALDHKTIEVHLERPTPYFLDMLSFAVFHPVNQSTVVRNRNWADSLSSDFVCNGPFRLKEWRVGDYLILEKNPYYWDAKNVELEEIHISLITCEQTALKLYEQGELDFLGLPFTGIVSDSIPNLMDKGMVKTSPLPASTICCFNIETFPFTNKNIRKAFAYAINRKDIIENITMMDEENGVSMFPKSLSIDSEPFFEDGDSERAKEYFELGLQELNISIEKLKPIKLLHASNGIYPKIAKAIQSQWEQVLGVNVKLESYEYKIFVDKLTKRDYQVGQCIWISHYLDPMHLFERFRSGTSIKNYAGYYNPEYEAILIESMNTKDPKKRLEYLKQAERILNEDMPFTAIYHWKNCYLAKDYIQNIRFDTIGNLFFNGVSISGELKEESLANQKKSPPRLGKS